MVVVGTFCSNFGLLYHFVFKRRIRLLIYSKIKTAADAVVLLTLNFLKVF